MEIHPMRSICALGLVWVPPRVAKLNSYNPTVNRGWQNSKTTGPQTNKWATYPKKTPGPLRSSESWLFNRGGS